MAVDIEADLRLVKRDVHRLMEFVFGSPYVSVDEERPLKYTVPDLQRDLVILKTSVRRAHTIRDVLVAISLLLSGVAVGFSVTAWLTVRQLALLLIN